MKAYILINTTPGTSEEVIKYLREVVKVEGVKAADSIFGSYDAIVTVETSGLEELADLVYRVIEKIPNVVRTETCIVLRRGGEE